jgi:plastocyanin
MGRLLAIALLVAAVGITIVVVNGPGKDKPEEQEAAAPANQSTKVSTAAPGGGATSNGAGTKEAPEGTTVHMKDLRFRPESVSVEIGHKVRFVNDDDVAHTVLEDFGPRSGQIAAVDSKRIEPGKSFTFVPTANGLIPYVCTLHPSVMVGQILVEKPPT